jgi:hypothetical protein
LRSERHNLHFQLPGRSRSPSLRQQVRYSNGTLIIKEQYSGTIKTFSATIAWAISCDDALGVLVDFGIVSENGNGVSVNLTGNGVSVDLTDNNGVDVRVCQSISGPLGAAVVRLMDGG